MNKIIVICEWQFSLDAITKRGKIYNKHKEVALGYNYDMAKAFLLTSLKSKKWELIKINSVKITKIAFAYNAGKMYTFIQPKKYHLLQLPPIPEIL